MTPSSRVGAEDHPGELGPTGPDKAGEADDLAGSDLDRHVAQDGGVRVVDAAGTETPCTFSMTSLARR